MIPFFGKLIHTSLPVLTKVVNALFSEKFLIYTNVGLSLCLSGLGDVLEQNYEIHNKELAAWDKNRTTHMAISGTTVGLVNHYWYQILDYTIPGYSVATVIKKIVADQLIGSTVSISTFFGTMALLEGSNMSEFCQEVKSKAWKLYAAEWMVWPPIQFLNFYVLSSKYRVLFDNFISLGYDIYTSRVKNLDQTKAKGNK